MSDDIYKPEIWASFFSMIGGGVVVLTGLVFIALSLGLDDMIKEATHKYRSINTLAGLTVVFVRCGFILMGGQNHEAIGIEWFVTAVVGAIIFLYGFRQAYKFGSQPSKWRLVTGTLLYAVEIGGALILLNGSLAGLYIASIGMVVNIAFMISAAWLLVVGLYGNRARP